LCIYGCQAVLAATDIKHIQFNQLSLIRQQVKISHIKMSTGIFYFINHTTVNLFEYQGNVGVISFSRPYGIRMALCDWAM
jgi:hypothetical protein